MKPILTVLLPVLLVAAACSDDEQPAQARARAYYQLDSLITTESVFVILKDGSQTWDFKPADFARSEADTLLYFTPEVETRFEGNLNVEIALFTSEGATIAEGEFNLPLSPNWRWTLGIIHSVTDPVADCEDCVGSDQFEIMVPGHDNEWIFILWRGSRV